MRFKPECDHGGNAGLGIARDLLEPIKKKHPNITYADLYILAGCVAVEEMEIVERKAADIAARCGIVGEAQRVGLAVLVGISRLAGEHHVRLRRHDDG